MSSQTSWKRYPNRSSAKQRRGGRGSRSVYASSSRASSRAIQSSTPVSCRSRTQTSTPRQDRHSEPPTVPSSGTLPQNRPIDVSDDVDELESHNDIIMAVDIRDRGTVGCCYYAASNEKLYFLEDVQLGHADTVEARMFAVFKPFLLHD